MGACLLAYSAADASVGACLLDGRSLVLIDAGDKLPHSARAFLPKLDNRLRASLHAGTASRALLLIHNRKTGLRIHRKGAELTGGDAITATKAAIGTACVSSVQ